ncbi:MAG: PIN domain-containing protein [bacterium]|nr:PIN domain-containing protein [bacterium]
MATRTPIDANMLACRYDGRFPDEQRTASEVLRDGITSGSTRIAYQSIAEFVAAMTRGGSKSRLLDVAAERREAEEFVVQFPILYPVASVLRTALRGAAVYGLSKFDAHLRACAEVRGAAELLSEDSRYGRKNDTVLVRNPFLSVSPAT